MEVNTIRNFMVKILRYDNDNTIKIKDDMEFDKVRTQLGQYDDFWIKNECSEKDMEKFFKWWYYPWKKECPPLKTRLWYFYTYASFNEILFTGNVFQNIMLGFKYDHELKGFKAFVGLVLSLVHMVIFVILVIISLCLGFVTFGYLWPKAINEVLFFGPIEKKDEIEKQFEADDQTRSQDNKLDKLDHKRILDRLHMQGSKIEMLESKMDALQQQNKEMISILKKMK